MGRLAGGGPHAEGVPRSLLCGHGAKAAATIVPRAPLPGTHAFGDHEVVRRRPKRLLHTVRGMRRLADKKRQFGFIYLSLVGPRESGGRADGIPIDARLAHLPLAEVAAPHACLCLKVAPEWSREALNGLNASGFRLRSCLLIPGPSLNPRAASHSGQDLLFLGIRNESEDCNDRLPEWMGSAVVLADGSDKGVYRLMEGLRPRPHLDVFASKRFSEKWTIVPRL